MAAIRRTRGRPTTPDAGALRAPDRPATPSGARTAAVRLLARRELSEAQLRARLLATFDEAQVDAALHQLRDAGAVDDRRVAFAYARTALAVKRRGHLRVERELEAMGIDRRLARAAVEAAREEVDEEALLTGEVARRARGRTLDERARARLYGQLLRRGFSADRVAAALRRYRAEPFEE